MDRAILDSVKNLFPGVNLDSAINQANQALQGKTDADAPSILKSVGVTEQGINNIYNKYGNNMKARAILAMAGTSPDQLKQQALGMISGSTAPTPKSSITPTTCLLNKYPRLK